MPIAGLVQQAEYILIDLIRNGGVDVRSPMTIVVKAMEVVERFQLLAGEQKQTLVLEMIERIAAGADGVVGTADDVLPVETVQVLRNMLNTNTLGNTIQMIVDIGKGKFDVNKAKVVVETVVPSCFECFKGILKRR
jgi:hypothetical protein